MLYGVKLTLSLKKLKLKLVKVVDALTLNQRSWIQILRLKKNFAAKALPRSRIFIGLSRISWVSVNRVQIFVVLSSANFYVFFNIIMIKTQISERCKIKIYLNPLENIQKTIKTSIRKNQKLYHTRHIFHSAL